MGKALLEEVLKEWVVFLRALGAFQEEENNEICDSLKTDDNSDRHIDSNFRQSQDLLRTLHLGQELSIFQQIAADCPAFYLHRNRHLFVSDAVYGDQKNGFGAAWNNQLVS